MNGKLLSRAAEEYKCLFAVHIIFCGTDMN